MLLENLSKLDLFLLSISVWLIYKVASTARLRLRTTRLNGPPATSWVYGVTKELLVGDSGAIYEEWMDTYGPVFQVPIAMGSRRTVLCDPKAIAHFYAREVTVYVKPGFTKNAVENLVGKGILWADGDDHQRQRKALTPAFSVASIRNVTPYFFDSAHKVKVAWESSLESALGDDAVVDVQKWMNCVSLDSVGSAGFSHSFGTLDEKPSAIADAFDSFNSSPAPAALALVVQLLSPVMPVLLKIPALKTRVGKELNKNLRQVAKVLLAKSRSEKAGVEMDTGDGRKTGLSIIEALMKVDNTQSEFAMDEEEVLAQMNVLILAGYLTTSVTMTWAFIELATHPDVQTRLREELSGLGTADPTYEQLTNDLPYLDAVTREVLRLHAPVAQTTRVASEDDVIPLSTPITTPSGKTIDRIHIARGANVGVPIRCMNRATSIWGADAKEFVPERWLNNEHGLPQRAKDIQGFHHLLTFVDGPRTCLGKSFAVTEIKTVLAVLVRNFVFSMRDGPETKIEKNGFAMRPRIAGEGYAMPLRVRRVAA